MPKYDTKCTECGDRDVHIMKIAQMEKGFPECRKCGASVSQALSINFYIPGHMTFDGTPRISGGSGKKEESNLPINVWDEKPDGSYKLTRIGKKTDIEND